MASTFLCVVPALLLLTGGGASVVGGTAVVQVDDPAASLEELDAFAEYLLHNNDFAEEEALLETESIRDLVPFIRNAFSTNEQSAGAFLLPKEEAIEFLEALQDVERLQDSRAAFGKNTATATDADKSVAEREMGAEAKNISLITSLLTRLVSLATVKNKVNQKASSILKLLTTITDNADKVAKVMRRVADLMAELHKLQSRLTELTDKFIVLLRDAISSIQERWEGTPRGGQKTNVLAFFQTLLKWADAAKQVTKSRWQLIKALFASQVKETHHQELAEEVATPEHLRVAKAAQDAAVEGHNDITSSPKHVASLDSLYREAEEARRIERDIAQSVWHLAAKCARDGLLPLPFVRVLLGES